MGLCQSDNGAERQRYGSGLTDGERCPTVFELEQSIEKKRVEATRMHVNLVNIEFRRGLFEMYTAASERKVGGEDDLLLDNADDDEDDYRYSSGSTAAAAATNEYGTHAHSNSADAKGARNNFRKNKSLSARTMSDDEDREGAAWDEGGRGNEMILFVATNKCTGRSYAVREVAVPFSRSALEVGDLWKRFDAQASLDHPNLCRLQEVFCSEERYYVVTDLCSGGDLMSRLKAQGRHSYEEAEVVDIIRKIAGALRHCHSESLVHGNLRVECCLFEDPGPWADLRIVDAGPRPRSLLPVGLTSSVRLGGRDLSGTGKRGKAVAWYMAPEVRSGEPCTEAGDMWNLGVLAWLVLGGSLLQPGMSQDTARSSLMVGKPSFKGPRWGKRSPEAVDFVSRLLKKDARQRITAVEALQHPWLRPKGPGDHLGRDIYTSICAFKDSCVMRRLGLRLVGHTLEASKLVPAKRAFRALDQDGRGYITEESLTKGLLEMPADSSDSSTENKQSTTATTATTTAATTTAATTTTTTATTTATVTGTTTTTTTGEIGLNTPSVPSALASTSTPAPSSASSSSSSSSSSLTCTSTSQSDRDAAAVSAAAASAATAAEAHELFEAMDFEGSGRVGFSAFLAACLAGRPADGAGVRVAFGWLDRRRKEAITPADMHRLTGQVLSKRELEEAFIDGHDALDLMSVINAGPIASAMRDMEARKSAASGAAGGFTYGEFYRLLAAVPSPPPPNTTASSCTTPSDLGRSAAAVSLSEGEGGVGEESDLGQAAAVKSPPLPSGGQGGGARGGGGGGGGSGVALRLPAQPRSVAAPASATSPTFVGTPTSTDAVTTAAAAAAATATAAAAAVTASAHTGAATTPGFASGSDSTAASSSLLSAPPSSEQTTAAGAVRGASAGAVAVATAATSSFEKGSDNGGREGGGTERERPEKAEGGKARRGTTEGIATAGVDILVAGKETGLVSVAEATEAVKEATAGETTAGAATTATTAAATTAAAVVAAITGEGGSMTENAPSLVKNSNSAVEESSATVEDSTPVAEGDEA